MMTKYVRVMDKDISNASGKKFKINEVNISDEWNPNATTLDTIKGINFSTDESILRWIRRGDTLYDVELPPDAEVIKCPGTFTPDGLFRTNKIIVKNPVPLTEDVVMNLYKISKLPERTYHDVLALLAIRKFDKVCDKFIKERINKDNIDNYLIDYIEFENDINDGIYGNYFEVRKKLEKIKINYCRNSFVRVMDGLKSNAGGFEYKLDEVNIATKWNPDNLEAEEMGGFNFGTEDKILRWLHRGDTLYDVIIPDDAEVVLVDITKGVYRANKIIVTNPRKITDEMVIELYKKSTLSNKIIAQCLLTLIWKDRLEISKYIIKDRVNMNNIDEILEEFVNYAGDENLNYESTQEIYNILKEIQSPIDISLYVDKEPYIKELTNDKVINLTGQSGSGKSTYAQEHYNSDDYLVIDTDEVLSEHRFDNSNGINRELGEYFRNKYKKLPNCGDDFDLIYKEILDYCQKYNKIIVIDCAQFHCIKDINLLKGQLIVIRTCIDTCYNRTIERFKKNNPNYTNEELVKYMEKKKSIFKWYKYSNEFIEKIDKL